MREKTAEEKLREELEGDSSGNLHDKELVRRLRAKKTARASNIGRKADSFIDDFERRVEQSINAGNIFKSPSEVQRQDNKPRAVKKLNIPAAPKVKAKPEPKAELMEYEILPEPETKLVEPETFTVEQVPVMEQEEPEIPIVEPETPTIEPEIPTVEPEAELEAPVVEPEILPEPVEAELEPEILPVSEQNEPESENLPISELDEQNPEVSPVELEPEIIPELEDEELEVTQELETHETDDGELPDIPVIEPDEIQDINREENESEISDGELPDIPVIEDDTGNENNVVDDTEENEEETPEESSSQTADIVVNVDDELPELPETFAEPDPEAEAVPVSVIMPESTKTAEDKLMADIAEAMTGSPLNLDSPEAPAPYQLPENFLNANLENSDPSQQSAEDKLIANIAQAMNESPLDTAQEQAHQNLEQDLNPFEEMSLPELVREEPEIKTEAETPDPEPETQDEQEEQEQEFLPDFSDNDKTQEAVNDIEEADPFALNDEQDEQENLDEPEIEAVNEVEPENFDDEPEQTQTDPQLEELMPPPEPEHEQQEDENEALELSPEEAIAMLAGDDDEEEEDASEENKDAEPEILTAEQRLQQEIANFSQAQPEPEINAGIISPEINIDTQENIQEEVQPENKMPEQSLLDENSQDINEENGDDWDISSLGELSEAASIPDDEPEDLTPQETPTTIIMDNSEQAEQEKTMGIREKLAERKNAASAKKASTSSSSSSGGRGGILLPILLGLLLLLGGVIAWQLHQISDKITMAMMNSAGFENVSGFEAPPSYDYTIDFILDPNIAERMAARGREGWQVVGSRRTQDSTTGQYGYEFIFMRRRSGR
ncbi:MAG: hypothetical protein IJU48_02085 [Synergistaceae bacterium]|nr:hypothetical protein [Synergistaceae bacterium]